MQGIVILLAVTTVGVEYGWELRDDGSVNYIIQVEPELLNRLRAGETVTSRIDPRLRNVRSFSIRVGSHQLPKELPQSLLETATEEPGQAVQQRPAAAADPLSDPERIEGGVPAPSEFPAAVDTRLGEARLRALEPPPADDLMQGDQPTRALAGRDDLFGDGARTLFDELDDADHVAPTADESFDDQHTLTDPVTGVFDGRNGEYEVAPTAGEGPAANQHTVADSAFREDEGAYAAQVKPIPYDANDDASNGLDDAELKSVENPGGGTVPTEVTAAHSPNSTESFQSNRSLGAGAMGQDPSEVASASQPTRRWMPLIFTVLALFASLGLNIYLGWIVWDTYNRYQDLLADMQSPESHGARAGL